MPDSLLRNNILTEAQVTEPSRILISAQFSQLMQVARTNPRSRTPYPAKNLNEFFELVRIIILDYERRLNIVNDGKIFFTEESPDYPKDQNIIVSFSLVKREPGAFSAGAPFEGDVKNLKPVLREEIDDPENPGYKRAIMGYTHDNEVKFTIWARTNKVANDKALWFENIMQEYSWYFTSQGVSRLIFMKRDSDFIVETNGSTLYGRPLHYFVKTETLTTVSEKTLEELTIGSMVENTSLLNVT